ncbi:primase-helicase zinc-binding domain-containing protein [Ferrimonas gelatinilytica]|uniref:DNA primase/helicase Gp4 N-terminal Bacteriophage T7-like domain-containing protein n=1 Tax=Ferrimonas gelatinilytica TaxID=1255257 RepID=A0ABP9RZP5_9GAMM
MKTVSMIADHAKSKWDWILPTLSVPVGQFGKHGPCPLCGGKDRFRITNLNGKGNYFCNQCGYGDGIMLVARYFGVTVLEAARMVAAVIDGGCPDHAKPAQRALTPPSLDEVAGKASWLLSKATTQSGGPYLSRKGLADVEARLLEDGQQVLALHDEAFRIRSAQLIDADGTKRFLRGTKLSGLWSPLSGPGFVGAGDASPAQSLLVAEGAGTALTGKKLHGGSDVSLAAASVLTAANYCAAMPSILANHQPSKLYLLADNDADGKGLLAASAAAEYCLRKVPSVFLVLPPEPGDWNDIYQKYGLDEARERFVAATVQVKEG